MRKFLAISIAGMMLTAGMQISIALHYCGGELEGSKLSVTGKLASCGMEKQEHSLSDQPSIDKRCCEDQLVYYSIVSKYLPEYFRLSNPNTGKDIPAFPILSFSFRSTDVTNFTSLVLPPGEKLKSGLTLSKICIFRV